ncbi:hypothetical protein MNEG_12979 [Monoraphidium neglectum]|jgi:hypothetical protein|uniref:Uncharacterized protein n=1 Tax=Monoraphidium neglectum TaxID=145388 RepID=A0A0D2J4Y4_9CHLO|nr:hypothetical protein MNEG_12979 [Monoraphidium neglectum]KIY94982.1 hypothetical protein MNEG_12979 [Monoraphidium neglectum]|eukprot:XP_013894002.1 hypothetical protein MNEG_12979 [Monoraphidium neglectum]
MSLLTPAEIGVLWDYQAKTGARSVKYGAPAPTIGFGAASAPGAFSLFYWTAQAPFGTSGVLAAAVLIANGFGVTM